MYFSRMDHTNLLRWPSLTSSTLLGLNQAGPLFHLQRHQPLDPGETWARLAKMLPSQLADADAELTTRFDAEAVVLYDCSTNRGAGSLGRADACCAIDSTVEAH